MTYLYSVADIILVLLPIYFIRMCTLAEKDTFLISPSPWSCGNQAQWKAHEGQ
jgi:hypothetical protein